MGNFTDFLIRRLSLREVTSYFPRQVFNELFRKECDDVLASEHLIAEVRADLDKVKSLDLVGYVDSSLRRSGFPEFELDELVSDILVRLLVTPGPLFKKWDRKGIMSARLKVAVRNSVITQAKKNQKRKKRFQELPQNVSGQPCRDDAETINAFRDSLRGQYGETHLRVLDVRLAGNDIKSLIGSDGMTAYRLKQIVQDIKHFAVGWGDDCLQRMVAQLKVREEETLRKRFGGKEAAAADR